MTVPSQMSATDKEQSQTSSSSSTSNSNDPVSLLVATLFDQKLAMFANNLPQYNTDQIQYQLTPSNTQLYPQPFDPVVFLAKQQQHRLI